MVFIVNNMDNMDNMMNNSMGLHQLSQDVHNTGTDRPQGLLEPKGIVAFVVSLN